MVPDALSRLQAQTNLPAAEKADILDYLYGVTTSLSSAERNILLPEVFIFYSTLVEITNNFRGRLVEVYINDE